MSSRERAPDVGRGVERITPTNMDQLLDRIADDGFPLRFVVFFHPNGVHPPTWWPQGTPSETQWELASSLQPLYLFDFSLG